MARYNNPKTGTTTEAKNGKNAKVKVVAKKVVETVVEAKPKPEPKKASKAK